MEKKILDNTNGKFLCIVLNLFYMASLRSWEKWEKLLSISCRCLEMVTSILSPPTPTLAAPDTTEAGLRHEVYLGRFYVKSFLDMTQDWQHYSID